MAPSVSVIIPTYNRASSIERAVRSVLGQSYRSFELIVVDDGSEDETETIIQKISKEESRIKYIKSTNHGVSHARNLGLKSSMGSLVAFLDSDDEWLPEKLQLQVNFLNSNQNLLWCHGNEVWKRNGNIKKQLHKHRKSGGNQFFRSLELCCISPSTVMLSKEILATEKWFKEDFVVCEDYDLWLRLTSKHKIGFIDKELIIKHGGHADQLSMKFHSMDYFRAKAIYQLLTSETLNREQSLQALETLKQKCELLTKGFEKHKSNEAQKILDVKSWASFARSMSIQDLES